MLLYKLNPEATELLQELIKGNVLEDSKEAQAFASYVVGDTGGAEMILPGITQKLRDNDYLNEEGKIEISEEDEKNSGLWFALTIKVLQGMLIAKNESSLKREQNK